MKKLAIVTTHPIQYYAPVFKLLAEKIELKVFYTSGENSLTKFDQGFKKYISWDLPLLDGYSYQFLKNDSKEPGTHHFKGISNADAVSAIKAFKPDALLVYGWANQSHLTILRHFKNKLPVYFRGDSTLIDQVPGIKNLLKKIFLRWVYSHVDTAFYVGSANKEYFKKYGLKENQLIFAPHAIDNERFGVARKLAASPLRKTLNVAEDEILILFAGKFEIKKNPKLLLNAFLELDLPNVHLLFVGNGQLEEELKFTIKNSPQTNSTSRIHFMDFQNQSQMPEVYQAADLFCLPSQGPGETWGLAVNEAMAAGKAILVSEKVGCAADLLTGENGAVFESNNLEDLKKKLKSLTSNKSSLQIKGKVSLEIIKNWSFEAQVSVIANYVTR